jgi:hypothetical protein
VLKDRAADPADRLIAAELAGDLTVIDNDLANVLLAVLRNKEEPEELRARRRLPSGPLEVAFTEFDEESGWIRRPGDGAD